MATRGSDLRHLNAPQSAALSSRAGGLADVVPTGIVRSNLAKRRAEGESLAELASTPRKPVDITETPRVDYGEQPPGDETMRDDAGKGDSMATPTGEANPTVSAMGAKGLGTVTGMTVTAGLSGALGPLGTLAGIIANFAISTLVGQSAKGQAAAAAVANSSLGPGMTEGATLGVTGDDLGSFGVDADAASPGLGTGPAASLGVAADIGSEGEGGFGAEGDMGGGFGAADGGDGGGGGGK